MNILAIETTSTAASVALIDDNNRIDFESSDEKLSHLQNLMPMIDKLLGSRQLKIIDIDYIAVSEGPGSFTGIRIGMAAAKGLAQVLDKKIVPVPTLLAMAYSDRNYDGVLCPMLDARRSQVYGGAYRWKAGSVDGIRECVELVPGGAYMEQELRTLAEAARTQEGAAQETRYLGDAYQRADLVAEAALDLLAHGGARSLFEVHPVYMRKAEAERKLEEKARMAAASRPDDRPDRSEDQA